MTRHWEPGTPYNVGEVLEYQGQNYRVIQAHTSQSDWAPGVATAALFQPLGSSEHHEPPQQCNENRHEHPQVPAQNTNPPDSQDRWLRDARQCTDAFNREGFRTPTAWVLTNGHNIPDRVIEGGRENDNTLFIARAYVEDGLYVGKAGRHLNQGAEIGRQHKCYAIHEYEILVGDQRAVRWVETHGRPNPQNIGARPINAGLDVHGHQIFIAQVNHNGGIHPARADSGESGAYLAYGDNELAFQEYRVLCYA